MSNFVQIEGMQHLNHMLSVLAPREATNVMRRTVAKQAAVLRKEIRKAAPRKTGTLKKAIKSRRKNPRRGVIEAIIYVSKGKSAKYDAWYWHFLEFGTVNTPAQPFIGPTAERFRKTYRQTFEDEFFTQFERSLFKARPR